MRPSKIDRASVTGPDGMGLPSWNDENRGLDLENELIYLQNATAQVDKRM